MEGRQKSEKKRESASDYRVEFAVVLHNVRSLHNVGSIFRTADGAGVKKIYLCGITPAPVDGFGNVRPQFAKVSLGAERYVKWEKRHATGKVLRALKSDGYKIFAIEQDKKSVPYYCVRSQVSGVKKVALVLGNEVRGLPPSILKYADNILEIPMRGAMVRHARHPRHFRRKMVRRAHHKESLNVAVAFGIVAYHLNL